MDTFLLNKLQNILLLTALTLPSVAIAETQQLSVTITIDDIALYWREIVIGVLLLYVWYLRTKLKKRTPQTANRAAHSKRTQKTRVVNPNELSALEIQELQRLARRGGK